MREIHLYYNYYLLGNYSCQLLGLNKSRFGAIAYLNILKNKIRNSKLMTDNHLHMMITKGRSEQLEVKRIYLTYNKRENNKKS